MTDRGGERAWLWWLGGVLVLVLLAHLRFLILDPRLPWDANLAYDQLPLVHDALVRPDPRWLLREVFTQPTAGYGLLLALPMAVGVPRPLVMELFSLLWVGLALGCVAGVARRLFGGPAAAIAVALLAGGWSVVVVGRSTWIHVPELALVLLLLWTLVRDPPLRRWSSVVLVALSGAMAMAIRPSGLLWVGSTLPLLLWGVLRGQPKALALGRLAVVCAAWALGACPAVVELWPYLSGKLGRREAYQGVTEVPVMLRQLGMMIGPTTAAVGVLGLGALTLRHRRALAPEGRGPVLVLLAWLLITPAVVLGFRAGFDNFPALAVALALLGAGGLAALPRPLWVLPGLVFLAGWLPQWLPEPKADRVIPLLRTWTQAQPGLCYRVEDRLDPATVRSLLDASCPSPDQGRCVVAVDHGLFSPSPEEPGKLELFLAGRQRTEVIATYVHDTVRWGHEANAFASFGCGFLEERWLQRRPGSQRVARQVLQRGGFAEVWGQDLGQGCWYRWYTPGGMLLDPEAMP